MSDPKRPHADAPRDDRLPKRSPWLTWGFERYVRWYMARRVHAVRLRRGGPPLRVPPDRPVVVVMNHPSWWDPLVVAIVARHAFPERAHFGPIDRAMLGRYRVFERLGLFGVEQGTPRGGVQFMRPALAITRTPATALWVTAQGTFRDVRARPIRLRDGIGRLAARMQRGVIVPMAVEMTFWDQRTPEVLIARGDPLNVMTEDGHGAEADQWTARLRDALEDTMDQLAQAAMGRDPEAFETILDGRAGVGGIYDLGRRAKAWLGGKRFVAEHPGPRDREAKP